MSVRYSLNSSTDNSFTVCLWQISLKIYVMVLVSGLYPHVFCDLPLPAHGLFPFLSCSSNLFSCHWSCLVPSVFFPKQVQSLVQSFLAHLFSSCASSVPVSFPCVFPLFWIGSPWLHMVCPVFLFYGLSFWILLVALLFLTFWIFR